ncbi:hypothetical protein WJX74_010796 [Apatococcus lobatus]|uniref:Mitochondrial carrier protein n=1 Tax=Apatococcus lobatus TaxID=904363 RepID=A0AAW1RK41_9CHLO
MSEANFACLSLQRCRTSRFDTPELLSNTERLSFLYKANLALFAEQPFLLVTPHTKRPRQDAFASVGIASVKSQESHAPPQPEGRNLLSALPDARQLADNAKHLLSGGMSAVVARTCVAPFERVKLEMVLHQRQSEGTFRVAWSVLQQEGPRGLWKGNLLNLLRTAPHKAVNFFSYDVYRKALLQLTQHDKVTNVERFLGGAMAGVTATLTCFPLDVLRTRIMAPGGGLPPGTGPAMGLARIVQMEGFGALYVGVLPAICSMAPSGAVFYGVYDLLKTAHLSRLPEEDCEGRPQKLTAQRTLLYGAISGAAAELACYPLEVVRRHMQMQHLHAVSGGKQGFQLQQASKAAIKHLARGQRAASFRRATADIWKHQGIPGFYSGVIPSVLQVLPNAALSYYAYEAFKEVLDVKG